METTIKKSILFYRTFLLLYLLMLILLLAFLTKTNMRSSIFADITTAFIAFLTPIITILGLSDQTLVSNNDNPKLNRCLPLLLFSLSLMLILIRPDIIGATVCSLSYIFALLFTNNMLSTSRILSITIGVIPLALLITGICQVGFFQIIELSLNIDILKTLTFLLLAIAAIIFAVKATNSPTWSVETEFICILTESLALIIKSFIPCFTRWKYSYFEFICDVGVLIIILTVSILHYYSVKVRRISLKKISKDISDVFFSKVDDDRIFIQTDKHLFQLFVQNINKSSKITLSTEDNIELLKKFNINGKTAVLEEVLTTLNEQQIGNRIITLLNLLDKE